MQRIRLSRGHPSGLFAVLESILKDARSVQLSSVYVTLFPGVRVIPGAIQFGSPRYVSIYLGLADISLLTVRELRTLIVAQLARLERVGGRRSLWFRSLEGEIMGLSRWTVHPVGGRSLLSRSLVKWAHRMHSGVSTMLRKLFPKEHLQGFAIHGSAQISAARMSRQIDKTWESYLETEVKGLVDAGFRLPLIEGYHRFLGSGTLGEMVWHYVGNTLGSGEELGTSMFPCLGDRLRLPARFVEDDLATGESLLLQVMNDINELESGLLAASISRLMFGSLRYVDWEDVGKKVLIPQWEWCIESASERLSGITLELFPEIVLRHMTNARLTPTRLSEVQAVGPLMPADSWACGVGPREVVEAKGVGHFDIDPDGA